MILLKNTCILCDTNSTVGISKGKITFKISDVPPNAIKLILDNTLTFPGLINSHDHLDYNLLPQFDTGKCNNYVEWARELTARWQPEIDAIRKVPEHLSTQWGLYKNLLNGITHVVNHNETIDIKDPLINIFKNCHSLHSVVMQRQWKYKLNDPFNWKWPYVFHIGEGIDEWSSRDIDTLLKWNYLGKKLIGVHGVAMNEKQAKKFKALIWCPDSNLFMFKKTAPVADLKRKVKMLFGTDSTLSANWSIWKHLRKALDTGMANKDELLAMLNLNAAEVWRIKNHGIKEGNDANLVVAKKKSADAKNAFFEIGPEDILLVICNGKIKLFDESIRQQLKEQRFDLQEFSGIEIKGRTKYVYGDLPGLVKNINSHCPSISFPFNC